MGRRREASDVADFQGDDGRQDGTDPRQGLQEAHLRRPPDPGPNPSFRGLDRGVQVVQDPQGLLDPLPNGRNAERPLA